MLLADPPRTQFDLCFSVFGIPVRIHPYFWLAAVFLGIGGAQGHPELLLIWIGVVFVSVLAHELGHAFAMRHYGWQPSVTLYAMGGFARYDRGFTSNFASYNQPRNREFSRIIIAAAGPAAGFLLAGITVFLTHLSGGHISFSADASYFLAWNIEGVINGNAYVFISYMLFINIFWGLINLLPIYPLDGGQISRELFVRYSLRDGIRQSLWLSLFTGAVVALYGLAQLQSVFMAIFFGYMAMANYQLLQSYTGGGGLRGRPW